MAQLNFQQSLLYSLQCHMILQRENADLVLKKPIVNIEKSCDSLIVQKNNIYLK